MGTSHVIAQFAVGAEIAIALSTVVRRINQFGVVLPRNREENEAFQGCSEVNELIFYSVFLITL